MRDLQDPATIRHALRQIRFSVGSTGAVPMIRATGIRAGLVEAVCPGPRASRAARQS